MGRRGPHSPAPGRAASDDRSALDGVRFRLLPRVVALERVRRPVRSRNIDRTRHFSSGRPNALSLCIHSFASAKFYAAAGATSLNSASEWLTLGGERRRQPGPSWHVMMPVRHPKGRDNERQQQSLVKQASQSAGKEDWSYQAQTTESTNQICSFALRLPRQQAFERQLMITNDGVSSPGSLSSRLFTPLSTIGFDPNKCTRTCDPACLCCSFIGQC